MHAEPVAAVGAAKVLLVDDHALLRTGVANIINQEHDLHVRFSPLVVYPCHERLDIFQDLERETEGWAEAIAEAQEVAAGYAQLRNTGRIVRGYDSTGMVEAKSATSSLAIFRSETGAWAPGTISTRPMAASIRSRPPTAAVCSSSARHSTTSSWRRPPARANAHTLSGGERASVVLPPATHCP